MFGGRTNLRKWISVCSGGLYSAGAYILLIYCLSYDDTYLFRRCHANVAGRRCRTVINVRQGTIFEGFPSVSLGALLHVIWLWAQHLSVHQTVRVSDVKKKKVIKFYEKLRMVCTNQLRRHPIRIGQQGQLILTQADETQMHHRQRASLLIVVLSR